MMLWNDSLMVYSAGFSGINFQFFARKSNFLGEISPFSEIFSRNQGILTRQIVAMTRPFMRSYQKNFTITGLIREILFSSLLHHVNSGEVHWLLQPNIVSRYGVNSRALLLITEMEAGFPT